MVMWATSPTFGASSLNKCNVEPHLWRVFCTITQTPETQNFGREEDNARH
jgi:hypothetical protein